MAGARDRIEVGGIRIAYERAGDGPPLLLLHGYVGDAGGTWRRQLDELSDEYSVVAWDAPGVGGSSDAPPLFGLAGYADCLAGFVDALGLERPHVAGLSFGGGLALELYERHPALPRSLILASAYAGWAGSLAPGDVAQRLAQVERLADLPPDVFVAEVKPTLFGPSAPPAAVERFAANVARFHPAGLRAMARSIAAADLRHVLPKVAVPTLLLYGEHDVRAPLEVAEAMHDGIAASSLVVLPGVGHLLSVEAPERFNAEVRAFLRAL